MNCHKTIMNFSSYTIKIGKQVSTTGHIIYILAFLKKTVFICSLQCKSIVIIVHNIVRQTDNFEFSKLINLYLQRKNQPLSFIFCALPNWFSLWYLMAKNITNSNPHTLLTVLTLFKQKLCHETIQCMELGLGLLLIFPNYFIEEFVKADVNRRGHEWSSLSLMCLHLTSSSRSLTFLSHLFISTSLAYLILTYLNLR